MSDFFRKQTTVSFFEFCILNIVKDDLGDYILTVLKQDALGIVFEIISIVLIGILAMIFHELDIYFELLWKIC